MLKQTFIRASKESRPMRLSRRVFKQTFTCYHSCSETTYASRIVERDTKVSLGFLLGGPRILV